MKGFAVLLKRTTVFALATTALLVSAGSQAALAADSTTSSRSMGQFPSKNTETTTPRPPVLGEHWDSAVLPILRGATSDSCTDYRLGDHYITLTDKVYPLSGSRITFDKDGNILHPGTERIVYRKTYLAPKDSPLADWAILEFQLTPKDDYVGTKYSYTSMLIPLTDNETWPSKETVDKYSWPVDKDGNSQYYTETPLEKCPPVDTANDGPTKPEEGDTPQSAPEDAPQSTPGDNPQSDPVDPKPEPKPEPDPADKPQSQPEEEKPQANTPVDSPQSAPTGDTPQSAPSNRDSAQSAKTPVKATTTKADTPQSSNGTKAKAGGLAETGSEASGLIAAAVSSLLAGTFFTRAAARRKS